MRDCTLGGWNRNTGMRSIVVLDEPLAQSLADTPDDSIEPYRLDASIRALAPAATAKHLRVQRRHAFCSGLSSTLRGGPCFNTSVMTWTTEEHTLS